VTELLDHLRATLGSNFSIERELGGGGMSRVFLAEDRVLGRRVVVKVLSPEIAASLSDERFTREIRFAASLQQANIVPLLSAGVSDGVPYYTMPFVEGQSLRHRLAGGERLTVPFVVNVLRDVARALAYAHERGVIHRDIKPENVLLSGEAAVVTDFGIAKAVSASRTLEGGATLTSAGVLIGTPAYMAPEQAVGDPNLDHRADIYAFGCLAYELLAGAPPFVNRTPQQLLVAHVQEQPRPITELRPDIPPLLATLVARCLSKSPAERPADAREILGNLDSIATTETRHALPPRRRAVTVAIAIVAIIGIAALAWLRWGTDAAPRTLAVMPFANIGGDSSQEYFADGIAIDLTSALSKVPGLRVTSRSLAFTYKGKTVDVRAVGKALSVGAVLEGTVQRLNDRLRVTCQLTQTSNGVALWSNTFERQAEDIFGVQDVITKSIVDELRLKLAGGAGSATAFNVAGTSNFDAYNSYLRGVYLLDHRGPGVAASVAFFKDAIARDSTFARAYGMLSEALELLPYFTSTPAVAVEAEAVDAARTALRLDSTVVVAHTGLALALDHSFRWTEAESEYLKAIKLDASDATAHMQYGRHLMHRGRIAEATAEFRRATREDPLSGTAFVWLAHVLALAGAYDSALATYRHAREVDPGLLLTRTVGAKDAIFAGNPALARSLAAGVEGSAPWRGEAAYALAKAGDTAAARATLRELERLPADTWLVHTGLMYTTFGLGDTARALTELEAAARAKEIAPKWDTFSDRMFDVVRHSPRFAAAMRSFNLDVDVMTSENGGRPVK
jgi:serine/threonine-protein kinase